MDFIATRAFHFAGRTVAQGADVTAFYDAKTLQHLQVAGWVAPQIAPDPPTASAPLTAADAGVVDVTYDATEAGVVNNLRTRVNELEDRLQERGFLPA